MEQEGYERLRQAIASLSLAIVVAAAIIGHSLPDPPRTPAYQGFVAGGKVVRLDTRSGNIVACDFSRCVRMLGNGKALEPEETFRLHLERVLQSIAS